MTTETKAPTDAELLATAIPIGVAKTSFTDLNDALLAVFIFGMGIGAESPEHARRLVDVGEGIIRSDERANAEFDRFLTGNLLLIAGSLR